MNKNQLSSEARALPESLLEPLDTAWFNAFHAFMNEATEILREHDIAQDDERFKFTQLSAFFRDGRNYKFESETQQ